MEAEQIWAKEGVKLRNIILFLDDGKCPFPSIQFQFQAFMISKYKNIQLRNSKVSSSNTCLV